MKYMYEWGQVSKTSSSPEYANNPFFLTENIVKKTSHH